MASSINNLASFLSATGYRTDVLDAAREAVTIYRRLVQANPAAHESNLVRSLFVLARVLAADGQKTLAHDAATEAVTRLRPWAAQFPEVNGDLLGAAEALVAKLDAP